MDTSEATTTEALGTNDENCTQDSEGDDVGFGYPNFLRSASSVSSASSASKSSLEETGFDVSFDAGGSVKIVTLSRKPFGIVFSTTAPVRVNKLRQGSHGEQLGIQPGWVVKEIAGRDMSHSSAEQVLSALQRGAEKLLDSSHFVDLVFIADGQEKLMTVPRHQFGISLAQTEPITVDEVKIDSQAEKLGVQAGWTIQAIAGQDVSNMEYFRAVDILEFSITPERNSENVTSFMKRMALGPIDEHTKFY